MLVVGRMKMKAQTILRLVKEDELGLAYVHEHLITNPPKWKVNEDNDLLVDDIDKMVKEVELFSSVGGKTLLECTAIDYGRNVKALLEIAKRVRDVNIIAVTGFNLGRYYEKWVFEWTIEALTRLMVRDITKGIDETTAKAGVIKVGTSYNNILPVEEKTIRAAARAHVKTKAPIMAHTSLGTMALEQVEIFEEEEVDPQSIAFCHIDQNLDLWYQKEICKKGAFLCYDGISKVKYCPDEWRIQLLNKLIKAGFENHILISGDMARKSYFRSYGGGPGLNMIITKFIPRLKKQGWSQKLIDKIFIENPASYLSFI